MGRSKLAVGFSGEGMIESILKEELEVDEGYMYSFDGLEKTVSFPIPEQYAAHMDVVMTRLETSTYSEDYVFSLAASEDETLLVMTTK